jgi:hypothetical protein
MLADEQGFAPRQLTIFGMCRACRGDCQEPPRESGHAHP